MSQEIVTRGTGQDLPHPLRAPNLSNEAYGAVRDYRERLAHGRLGKDGVPVMSPRLRQHAAEYVAEADRYRAAASPDLVFMWLLPIVNSAGFPISQAECKLRAVATAEVCSDLPGWVFNHTTRIAAMRKFTKFPGAAEIREFLREETSDLRGTVEALRALSKVEPPKAERDAKDPDEMSMEEFARHMFDKHGYRMEGYQGAPEPAAEGEEKSLTPIKPPSPAVAQQVRSFREQLYADYAKQAQSSNPVVAKVGRAAMEAMDKARKEGKW